MTGRERDRIAACHEVVAVLVLQSDRHDGAADIDIHRVRGGRDGGLRRVRRTNGDIDDGIVVDRVVVDGSGDRGAARVFGGEGRGVGPVVVVIGGRDGPTVVSRSTVSPPSVIALPNWSSSVTVMVELPSTVIESSSTPIVDVVPLGSPTVMPTVASSLIGSVFTVPVIRAVSGSIAVSVAV